MPFDDVALHKGGVARLQLRDDPVGGFHCVQVIANHISDGKTSSAEVALLGGAVVAAGGACTTTSGLVCACALATRTPTLHEIDQHSIDLMLIWSFIVLTLVVTAFPLIAVFN